MSQLQYVSDVYSKVILWTTVHMQIPHSSVEKYSYISHIIKQQQQRLTAQHKYEKTCFLFSFLHFRQRRRRRWWPSEMKLNPSHPPHPLTNAAEVSIYVVYIQTYFHVHTYRHTYVHTYLLLPLPIYFSDKKTERTNERLQHQQLPNKRSVLMTIVIIIVGSL